VQQAPGIPCALCFWAEGFMHNSDASRRENADAHLDFNVIASQRVGAKRRPMTGSAKQSISPRKARMDCFVALLLAIDGLAV
jgi:hypothetical protein